MKNIMEMLWKWLTEEKLDSWRKQPEPTPGGPGGGGDY